MEQVYCRVDMGGCGSKCNGYTPQPGIIVDSKIVKRVIRKTLNVPKETIFLSDRSYKAYEHDDYVRFLKGDLTDKRRYYAETFDCDDFALVLAAASKRWSGENARPGQAHGCCFGVVWGDIRTDERPNPHAVNFFIDAEGELWLVEPQTDKIFKPTPNSDFWMCIL